MTQRSSGPIAKCPWYRWVPRFFQRLNRNIHIGLRNLIDKRYRPLLEKAVDNRGVTFSLFAGVLVLTIGLMNSGIVRTVLFPDVPGDFIQVQMTMQNGTAPRIRNAALDRLEQAALELNEAWVAENPGADPPINHLGVFTQGDTGGQIFAEMPMDENRPLNGEDIEIMWRDRVGEIAGVKELTFSCRHQYRR